MNGQFQISVCIKLSVTVLAVGWLGLGRQQGRRRTTTVVDLIYMVGKFKGNCNTLFVADNSDDMARLLRSDVSG